MSLRGALTANLPPKLTSLGLSVFRWLPAAGEEPATRLVPVDLRIRAPEGRTIIGGSGPVLALVRRSGDG